MKTIVNIGIHKRASVKGIEFNKPFNEITYKEIQEIAVREVKESYLGTWPENEPIVIEGWADVTDKYIFSEDKFFELADKTKLTAPQKRILDMLKDGYRIVIVNKHHMSGGQWEWKEPDGSVGHLGGKIYRPFWNLMRAVLRGNGYTENIRYLKFIED